MKVYLTYYFENYTIALSSLGAEPVLGSPEGCDALLLPGGADIDPTMYGQQVCGSEGIDTQRDSKEKEAVELFLRLGKPIMGICRGCQFLNVYFGGTLHQHVPQHPREDGKDALHYTSTTDPELISIYGKRFIVNSAHHQTLDELGKGISAVQWADDGVIEAIRHETLPVFAVQWHPERLREPTDGWKLIASWLDFVKEYGKKRS